MDGRKEEKAEHGAKGCSVIYPGSCRQKVAELSFVPWWCVSASVVEEKIPCQGLRLERSEHSLFFHRLQILNDCSADRTTPERPERMPQTFRKRGGLPVRGCSEQQRNKWGNRSQGDGSVGSVSAAEAEDLS